MHAHKAFLARAASLVALAGCQLTAPNDPPRPRPPAARDAAAAVAIPDAGLRFPRTPASSELREGCPQDVSMGGMCARGYFCVAAAAVTAGAAAAPFDDCLAQMAAPQSISAGRDMATFQPGTTCTDRALTHQRSCCYEFLSFCAL